MHVSCYTDEGVNDVKTTACDKLLAHRVENKLKGTKINSVINRIHVAQPKARDDVVRAPFIPDAVKERVKYDPEDPMRRRLERDIEAEEGGAGVFNMDTKKNYLLAKEEWKHDIIPEILDGKNIADFIDPDILSKLEALEAEEEKLAADGFYDDDDEEDIVDSDEEAFLADLEHSKSMKGQSERKKMFKNRPVMPRTATAGQRTVSDMTSSLAKAGYDTSRLEAHVIAAKAIGASQRKRKRAAGEEGDESMDVDDSGEGQWEDEDASMEVDGAPAKSPKRVKGNSGGVVARVNRKVPRTNRMVQGLKNSEVRILFIFIFPSHVANLPSLYPQQESKAIKLRNLSQRERNYHAKAGEADHAITTKMPKHLFAGKRKGGKTDRR